MTYLKSNLVYCFQNSVRMDVQESIDQFEKIFFKSSQRENKQWKAISDQDNIEESDLQEVDNLDKKQMRRDARKQRSDEWSKFNI